LESIQNTINAFFITDKNYTLPKEKESIIIHKYFDVSKSRFFSFTIQNNDLFLILNQNTFGSAFFGNTVITEPRYFILKKFNPIWILIQIIYYDNSKEDTKEINKKINTNDFIDTNAIIQKYEDILKTFGTKIDLFNNNFDSISKSSLNFVKYIFDKYSNNIELIAEIKEIDNNGDKEKRICAKRCESKVYNYLNSKVNLNSEENKEIENSGAINEDEKEILTKRKIYEKITILEPFLPNDLYKDYLKYKHIDFLNEDEISVLSNESENKNKNKNNKRKHEESTENQKKKNRKKNKEEPVISKGQKTINLFFDNKK
jgi:hypothetical protein